MKNDQTMMLTRAMALRALGQVGELASGPRIDDAVRRWIAGDGYARIIGQNDLRGDCGQRRA